MFRDVIGTDADNGHDCGHRSHVYDVSLLPAIEDERNKRAHAVDDAEQIDSKYCVPILNRKVPTEPLTW